MLFLNSHPLILQPLMREQNFSLTRLDGTMSHMVRSEVVTAFQSDHPRSPKVLLLSLKAGGVGLNLTAANHLLLLDPFILNIIRKAKYQKKSSNSTSW